MVKSVVVRVFLLVSLGVNVLFANPVNDFADKVAYGIFSTAWPTATYKKVEMVNYHKTSYGYDIVLKFNGNSNMCMVGDCPLWFTLDMQTDSNFFIKNMSVLDYNSIIAKPFQTAGAVAQAVRDANSR